MPLRDDLLQPIEGDNPSGANLTYDKAFDQIKEARIEDDDSIPAGDWGRAVKKADRNLVIKLAGETLAKRTKDIRLAGWYLESLIRKEGISQLVPGLDLLLKLEEQFWETIYPQLDDDGNADLRIGAVELAGSLIAVQMKQVALTRGGLNWGQYQDARAVGFETEDMSDEKRENRADAIARGKLTGEDLQKSIDATPKAFYAEAEASLGNGLELLDDLDRLHDDKYGDDPPSLSKLKSAIEEVKKVIGSILNEKRKTDPDPLAPGEEAEEPAEESDVFARFHDDGFAAEEIPADQPAARAAPRRKVPVGTPTDAEGAYAQVAACAEFLRAENPASPVPYLLCAGLRLGETRASDPGDPNFAVAPPTETRQALRRLANDSSWDDLTQLGLRTLAEPCGRVWLDLQRYLWRAAYETGNSAVACAVLGTVRALLTDIPTLRETTLDDDTPAANAETLQWIAQHVLPPPQESATETEEDYRPAEPIYQPPVSVHGSEDAAPDIYQTALQILKQGRMGEAISLLVRDSELQPSGRMRFLRRVQMAQLCLAADQAAVAYPVLLDLSAEMERRGLETWEAAETLSQPLSLLLRCVDLRKGGSDDREAIFARLCRLDPQAALTIRR
jgi:type VI secretion system protein ImpA